MKKVISLLAVILCVLSLGACTNKQSEVKEQLKEDIPNAYVGDVDVEKKIEIADLTILIKKTVFYVNDIEFSFKEFENTQKLSTNMGESMLEVYVKDGALEKCVVFSDNATKETVYNVEGKSTSMTVTERDDFGNDSFVAYYDGDGNLQHFYTASYEKTTLKEKREYNADLDLTAVIKYEYDEDGKLIREITYDASLKLQDVKEY